MIGVFVEQRHDGQCRVELRDGRGPSFGALHDPDVVGWWKRNGPAALSTLQPLDRKEIAIVKSHTTDSGTRTRSPESSEQRRRHQEAQKARRRNNPERHIFTNILQRCYNPNNPAFARYGGRGITVCDRWRESFEVFLADMGRRPSPKHSIDRIDNDGHYEPSNCRWATSKEQRRNRRDVRHITFNGESLLLTEWAARLGENYRMLAHRLERRWPIESALTEPRRKAKPRARP